MMKPAAQGFSFFNHPRGRLLTILLTIVFVSLVALDQFSKREAQTTLLIYEDPTNQDLFQGGRVSVGHIGNPQPSVGESEFYVALRMQYSRNRGAAFSMLSEMDDRYRVPFFYAVTVIAVIMIGFYLRTTPLNHYLTRLGLVMILAGAIGNFIDRVYLGYVIDFVDVEWNILGWRHDFAIFNVADIAINLGVLCLIIDMIVHREKKDPVAAKETSSTTA